MKNLHFQNGHHGSHLGFPIRTILAIFNLSHPDASYQVSSQLAFGFREKKRKKDFQDGHQSGPLGLLISMVLAIFDLQVTLMLPTKFGSQLAFRLRRRSEK